MKFVFIGGAFPTAQHENTYRDLNNHPIFKTGLEKPLFYLQKKNKTLIVIDVKNLIYPDKYCYSYFDNISLYRIGIHNI